MNPIRLLASIAPLPLTITLLSLGISGQVGTVVHEQEISTVAGSFAPGVQPIGRFGSSIAPLGDLDGDGVLDIAVGAPEDFDGGFARGAVWILFLDCRGGVKSQQKISHLHGSLGVALSDDDRFGESVSSLGDLDGDGVVDLAVGTHEAERVWILRLNSDGTVKATHVIDGTALASFPTSPGHLFGISVAGIGDLDGDLVPDLAVGTPGDPDGTPASPCRGAVHVLFLNPDGSVKSDAKISLVHGGFTGPLGLCDEFGFSLARIDDIDGNGLADLAVGAWLDKTGGNNRGAVWLLGLNADGSVNLEVKIDDGTLPGALSDDDLFGSSITAGADLDGDGVGDLIVGASGDADGCSPGCFGEVGAVHVLLMQPGGVVHAHQKISAAQGGFGGSIGAGDRFGIALAIADDVSGDGVPEIFVGADQIGSTFLGAVWTLFVDGAASPSGGEATLYGCGGNPAGSLTSSICYPALGHTITLGVDNPLGTQTPGSVPFLAIGTTAAPGFPCGTSVPGLGMTGGGAAGELLVGLAPPPFLVLTGPPWLGSGIPSSFDVPIPQDATLLGGAFFAQGLLVDPAPAASPALGLTEGIRLVIGT